jgi:hypothetical protein
LFDVYRTLFTQIVGAGKRYCFMILFIISWLSRERVTESHVLAVLMFLLELLLRQLPPAL